MIKLENKFITQYWARVGASTKAPRSNSGICQHHTLTDAPKAGCIAAVTIEGRAMALLKVHPPKHAENGEAT